MWFATKDWITQQLVAEAQKYGMDVVSVGQICPEPLSFFSPPYFWESDRALRRSIMHFVFTRRQSSDDKQKAHDIKSQA
jgi:hypothetical protein